LFRACLAILLLLSAVTAGAQISLTRGTNFSLDVAADGRIVFDLLGDIWVIPNGGGVARAISAGPAGARRPRWSPGHFFDHHPSWHPDGDRIVYSSDRLETGIDLWELDLATGLTWRISRRHAQPDRMLLSSTSRLSSPAWRPDGSLITFLRHGDDALTTEMVILSEPLLIRALIEGEDFFVAPVAWRDRQSMLYAANGLIRKRDFNSWTWRWCWLSRRRGCRHGRWPHRRR